jgi:formate hydrogenlyase transcriptional activator
MTSAAFKISAPCMCPESTSSDCGACAKRFEILSRLSMSLVSQRPEDLPCNLVALIRPLLDFDFLDLIAFKEGSSEVLWHSVGVGQFPPPDVPMEETTYWWVYQQKQPLFISDWKQDARFAARREALKHLGFEYRSLCRLPLRTSGKPIGVLSFASFRPHTFSEEEMCFLSTAADQVSLALVNVLQRERSYRAEQDLEKRNEQITFLDDLAGNLVANRRIGDLLRGMTAGVRRVVRSDFSMTIVLDSENSRVLMHCIDPSDNPGLDKCSIEPWREKICSQILSIEGSRNAAAAPRRTGAEKSVAGFTTTYVQPIGCLGQTLGFLAIAKQEDVPYTRDEAAFLKLVSNQMGMAIHQATVNGELKRSETQVRVEGIEVKAETSFDLKFSEIVGASSVLQEVLRNVEVAAPTDCCVFIGGETGTGKELIARAIHHLSRRRDRPFVKVNCAAIPSGLLESELFGHEKGAFTGAIARKAGRFEAADKGTLFLDEVGDIPLDLQPKLLRVLQEREFEKLGSTRTQKVDVRVVAATHRNIAQMVVDGEFRADLYYRLHVFPVNVPPLRDRREDIPVLVRHYVNLYARRMNRRIGIIPPHTMAALEKYPWPGNVRELQNFIERAVILSPGNTLRAPLSELKSAGQSTETSLCTLEDAEREHVLRALRESNWVIGGRDGAAARLGMKRTTLAYRIRKLRIPCRPV